MAATLPLHSSLIFHTGSHGFDFPSPNPSPAFPLTLIKCRRKSLIAFHSRIFEYSGTPEHLPAITRVQDYQASSDELLQWSKNFIRLTMSSAIFLGLSFWLGIFPSLASSSHAPPSPTADSSILQEDQTIQDNQDEKKHENVEMDKELEAAFKSWKSKTYALTVPLRIVALRGSVPPSWMKDFIKSQGRRLKFQVKFYGSIENIFSELSTTFTKGNLGPSSALAADVVSIGDSWLKFAIKKAIIQPIQEVEEQDWFKDLGEKWKVYLRRNSEGEIDPKGNVWAAPYRWGCMVIAYRTNKFKNYKFPPMEDWADLWRPELAGKISMVDSPREVVGAVLKYMGASYNTNNINLQVAGGRDAVKHNLALLGKQVRLFDSIHYLKAFSVGDVWVAVGWSSDVIPVAKRMSNVAVIVPNSGASLWADLWGIPAASKIQTNRIGGRVRGPSPLTQQWIEFCLQAARSLPFKQEVVPGSSPSALHGNPLDVPADFIKGRPRLETNLIAGTPPADILERCEFLEPLSDSALSDYHWLISSMQEPQHGVVHQMQRHISSIIKFSWQPFMHK